MQSFKNAGQFSYRHWPRNSRTEQARTTRAIQIAKALRGTSTGSETRVLRRFASMYRGNLIDPTKILKRNINAPRTLLLAGYTCSGKSTAGELLEERLRVGRTVRRRTTATWNPGEDWEKSHYVVVTNDELSIAKHEVFALHTLLNAEFAFERLSFESIPVEKFRILPLGWSLPGIQDAVRYCYSQGDEPTLLVFWPENEVLANRISKRWGTQQEITDHLREAEEFYEKVPPDALVINSSGSREDLWYDLLDTISPYLSATVGWDVAISYAGPAKQLADSLRSAFKRTNISAYVVAFDGIPGAYARAQDGIDAVFSVAEAIVVIWSKDFPLRQYSTEEWMTWIDRLSRRDQRRLVFLQIDETPLPPEVREYLILRDSDIKPDKVASVVAERLSELCWPSGWAG